MAAVGISKTSTYRSWVAMMSRCYRENTHGFERYGGRGISVCKRWHDYGAFLEDMGPRPTGMTLDRVDNNGNYEFTNCRWADAETQQNNRRTARVIEFNGRRQTLAQWARETGISRDTIKNRLKHVSPSVALTAPIVPINERRARKWT